MWALLDANQQQWEQAPAELGPSIRVGELLSPLTRRAYRGGLFGVDNGCWAGFPRKAWESLLERNKPHQAACVFVNCPDVVGSARRTLELFDHFQPRLRSQGWPVALVAQDGQEDLPVPWQRIDAIFIGGSTAWKLGPHAEAVIRAAQALCKWVHVGRVNTPERFDRFLKLAEVEPDRFSFDGSGISQYSHMRRALTEAANGGPLFRTEAIETDAA